jgi:hypothetical protein
MSDIMSSLIIFIGSSLIGWIFIGVAIYVNRYQRKKELTERELATGKIVDIVKKVHSNGRGGRITAYVPVVEFEVNGKIYHLENENGTRHLEEIEIGKSVDIMYDPDNPTHFHMTSADANETGSNSLIRFAIIIIIGAAILAVTNHYYHFL